MFPPEGIACGRRGLRRLTQSYGVFFGSQGVGKVQVQRQGLYYRFQCRCQLSGEVMCRLYVRCGDQRENLGVVVPMDGGFGLDTRIPVKRLGEGPMAFSLIPKHSQGQFCPICPEEPFSYISRLKEGFLARQEGQIGLIIPQNANQ